MRQAVFGYVKERYGTEPEYLWASSPDSAVLRHRGSGKWYAAVLRVERTKLGLTEPGTVWVLNVKCEPGWTYLLHQQPGILPAYHMNKEHWVSVLLDGTVPRETLEKLIDSSYGLVAGK